MDVRSDFALELQLGHVGERAQDLCVKEALGAVFAHMKGGRGRNRLGGKTLITLLAKLRSAAAAADEWEVVRLVQDSLDYAEGRILRPDFEERYRRFRRLSEPPSLHQDHLARMFSTILQSFVQICTDYLDQRPEAQVDEVLAYVEALGRDARYMQQPHERTGRYRILRGTAEMAAWLEQVFRERIDIEDPEQAARRIVMSPDSLAVLATDQDGQLLFRAAEVHRRRQDLKALRKVVQDPGASEHDLQRALDGQHWIFGGQFASQALQRRLVPGDEVDIPLIRGDGALHVVELKRSMSLHGSLVKRHRGRWVPTAEVHDAVNQAVNYLVGLDEHRIRIKKDLGIETRRASALVLIGHPSLQPDVAEEDINDVLRTLNTHINRVDVMTYKELVDNAERALSGWK
ncbi:Shedu anti-phage system protein SduA domain-containing protein [Streptomyces sp. LaPpAH-108]|uniref:Shedu anti-phage system protein SduA domain-containing protein n=1 Tax=Streptomyces sp. LaPpAH-108 TaxID=1155714 RepID=UPI001F48DBA3|nr:Shedu anti-phage system protein SduA domain-containing protein [Streptomyces sp. LaPpAH-108]